MEVEGRDGLRGGRREKRGSEKRGERTEREKLGERVGGKKTTNLRAQRREEGDKGQEGEIRGRKGEVLTPCPPLIHRQCYEVHVLTRY